VPGSTHKFPECPAAFLRTPDVVAKLRVRRPGYVFADHLIGGTTHPDELVAPLAHEFKNGARTADSMSVTEHELVFLRISEENDRDRHADEMRDKERQANAGKR
jgi:hypothetical protein